MSTNATGQKLLAYMRVSNEANKRYQDLLEKTAAESQAVKVAAAQAVKSCVEHDRIFGHQKDTVMQKLAESHPACLEFITDLAKHRNADEIGAIGVTVGQEKSASARPITGAPIYDHDETESGRLFRERLTGAR